MWSDVVTGVQTCALPISSPEKVNVYYFICKMRGSPAFYRRNNTQSKK
jgi:hypothetical protein